MRKVWQGCKMLHKTASQCFTAFSAYVVPMFNVEPIFLERSLNFSNLQQTPSTPIHYGNAVLRLIRRTNKLFSIWMMHWVFKPPISTNPFWQFKSSETEKAKLSHFSTAA